MTIILDEHPLLSATMMSGVVALFIVASVWLVVHSVWKRKAGRTESVIVGAASTVICLGFGVTGWQSWSPWAVRLADDAVELRYLQSTQRIEYATLDHVEFKFVKSRRGGGEHSILRLSSGGRVYDVRQDPEPDGDIAQRPVRQIFDQLARHLPPDKVHDLTK